METGDGGDEAEAEPVAGSAATLFKPIEALEDVLTLSDGNSWTVIGNRDDGIAVTLFDLNRHLARVTAMLDGVVDEIGHRLEQKVSVGPDEHAPVSYDLEMPALFLRCSVE